MSMPVSLDSVLSGTEHETAVAELEKRQLLEKQQLEEMQLKEKFILQRQLLMTRQAKVSRVARRTRVVDSENICNVVNYYNLLSSIIVVSVAWSLPPKLRSYGGIRVRISLLI